MGKPSIDQPAGDGRQERDFVARLKPRGRGWIHQGVIDHDHQGLGRLPLRVEHKTPYDLAMGVH